MSALSDRVAIAGARPVHLQQFEPFDNVHVLCSMNDARRLRESLQSGRRIGIIGALRRAEPVALEAS